MKEITNTYEPSRLETIKRVLENEQRRGSPRFYEIWVDGVKVVEKTDNPEEFSKYEEFIFADTQKVTVNLFTSSQTSSHIVSRHHFTFGEEEKSSRDESLRGFGLGEIEARINEKVSLERERWDCEQVKKDLGSTKDKLREAEEYIGQLQDVIDETKKKLTDANGMGEIASVIKDLALPHLLGKKPEEKTLSGNEKPKEEASFKMKSSEEEALPEADKAFMEFGRKLRETFNRDEFDMVLLVIDEFMKDKTNIKPVTELLNINPQKK
ncbi:MAG: hypothetical protein IT233_09100 [Bacteroidia bacterium]|nr:hypothetical protein [Bacteroidia bacterium]